MERDEGNFHHERRRKRQQQPRLHIAAQIRLTDTRTRRGIDATIEQGWQIECVAAIGTSCDLMEVAQGDNADQHQEATKRRVQHEFEDGVDAALTTPTANQEVGGDEHHFPAHIEQEEIGGQEHAQHAALEEQHKGHIAFDLLLNAERGRHTDSR
jgi:hypothetical protein